MKNKLRCLQILLLLCFSVTWVQGQTPQLKAYEYDSIIIGSNTFRYGLLKPNDIEPGKKYPLILALHGSEWYFSANSDDPQMPLYQWNLLWSDNYPFYMGQCWSSPEIQAKYPAYVLVPHISDHYIINESRVNPWYTDSALKFVNTLMYEAIANEQVDTNRIYVTGHSIGGHATYLSLFKLAHKVAAIAPMAGWNTDWLTNKIENDKFRNVSVWNFHHGKDSPTSLKKLFSKFQSQGYSVVYTQTLIDTVYNMSQVDIQTKINNRHRYLTTEYNGDKPELGYHFAMEFASQDTLFHKWLFNQYLIDEDATLITHLSPETYELNWSVKNPSDTVEIWFRENNDWELVTKGVFAQSRIALSDYLTENRLQQGYVRVASINSEGFMYGKDEQEVEDNTSGTSELHKGVVKVFPNPASDIITITTDNFLMAQVYDLSGRLMMNGYQNRLDVSSLTQGVYILKVFNKHHKSFTQKILIHE